MRNNKKNSGYVMQVILLLVSFIGLALFLSYFRNPQFREKFLEAVSPKINPQAAETKNVELIQFDPYEAYENGTLRNKISSRKVVPGQKFVYFVSSKNLSANPSDINIIIWLGDSLNYLKSESKGGSCNWYADNRKLNCYYRAVKSQGNANLVIWAEVSPDASPAKTTTTLYLRGTVGSEITNADILEIVKPIVKGKYCKLSSLLTEESANFTFSYSGQSAMYMVDLSTQADMAWDVYLDFAKGSKVPITVTNPLSRWDKYQCGKTLYWRVYNADRSVVSPIQATTINCCSQ
jgi:hypothetical protein